MGTKQNKNYFFLISILLCLFFAACAKPRGVIVTSIMPAEIDITSDSALEGDAVTQAIIVDEIRTAGKNIVDSNASFHVKNALKDALTKTSVFNIRGAGGQMNVPRIRPIINKFAVERDVVKDGFVTRRGIASVSFSLVSSSGNHVGSTTETAEIVNTQPLNAQLRSKEEIMQEMAEDVCREFVRKIVPTPKKEFREFASGTTEVNNGINAAMNKDWDFAIEIWEGVIAKKPDNAPAQYNLGIAYEAKNQLRKALNQYKTARQLDQSKDLYQKSYARLKKRLETTKQIQDIKDKIKDGSVGATD
ncbi:MAG: tetratricopeptide repeat protein [Desulfobacterales bacterium]|nr:tetratricopeptide repeat protein [Desulfobacterales bacterium]